MFKALINQYTPLRLLVNTHTNIYTFTQQSLRPFNQIVIVRHGESIWNKKNKWAGWSDVPLSTDGIKQAR